MNKHLPDISGPEVRREKCYYTMTGNSHFMVGSSLENDGLIFAAGLSGHGFKFTAVLGEALADLAIDGQTTLPIDFLSPSLQLDG